VVLRRHTIIEAWDDRILYEMESSVTVRMMVREGRVFFPSMRHEGRHLAHRRDIWRV
jgi:hypothetical protein